MITGSIQVKKGFYYAVLNLKDKDGKRKQKWIPTKFPDDGCHKKKAEQFLRKQINECENKIVDFATDGLFCDYMVEWLESRKGKIELITWESYERVLNNHIYPYFKEAKVKLQDLTAVHLEKYYDNLIAKGCCANTAKHHHANIRHCLKKAVKDKLIPYNVASAVELPTDNKIYVPEYYSDEQAKKLLEVARGTDDETFLLIAVYYGLRRSEIAGLVWGNIDFENREIHIRQKRVQAKTEYVAKKNKTKSSTATLPLIDKVYEHLAELRVKQEENRKFYGNTYCEEEHDFICRKPNGESETGLYVEQY